MDLNFSEDQDSLREMLRPMLEEHSNTDIVRELEDDPKGYRPELWDQLRQLDLIGLCLPAEHGGVGMGPLESVVLYEELGRALANTPHLVSAVAAAGIIKAGGSAEQQAAWLPKIASGGSILSVAQYEPHRSDGPDGIGLAAKADGDTIRLSGTKIRVPYASSAEAFVVLARGEEGIDAFIVPAEAAGLSLTQSEVLSSEAEYEVTFSDVEVSASARIGAAGTGWDSLTEAMLDVSIAVASYAMGGARKTHEITVEYASEREQFGRKIGGFQGLAHPIADIYTEINGAEQIVRHAAVQRERGEDCSGIIAMAKYIACDVYKRTTKVGQQVFGGVGFTRAIDVQLYTRRAKQLEITWGGPARNLEVVAAAELDGEPFVSIPSAV